MKHFLVSYDQEHVVSIKEFESREQASEGALKLHDQGKSANVFSAEDQKHLGINIGDPEDNEGSEFAYRGLGEEEKA